MVKEKRKVLEMLAKGKVNVDEAEKLLSAVSENEASPGSTPGEKTKPRYLRVVVEPAEGSKKHEKVNVRVPFKLIRSGIKWAAFIPKEARDKVSETLREKGLDMDFASMKNGDLEELIENLSDLTVEVEGEEMIRVFCE